MVTMQTAINSMVTLEVQHPTRIVTVAATAAAAQSATSEAAVKK
ncbi:hypothetical protein P9G84_25740 [Brevibacillus centrosporus]|nr:hypothetical protein [Brevibacillus centrosporus]MEC2132309.1 hypothetical protein [Brevibacillus centrosporus]